MLHRTVAHLCLLLGLLLLPLAVSEHRTLLRGRRSSLAPESALSSSNNNNSRDLAAVDESGEGISNHSNNNSSCPLDPYVPLVGTTSCSADDEGLVCEYGQECCCDECSSEMTCTCEDGVFVCGYTDFCYGVEYDINGTEICNVEPQVDVQAIEDEEPCPESTLQAYLSSNCTVVDQVCDYGRQECCCGECMPEVECTCQSDGSYDCSFNYFCLFRPTHENGTIICS